MARSSKPKGDELRPEYDFSTLRGAVRGKYYKRALAGTNLVLLDPDVARLFPDARSVNEALRVIGNVAKRTTGSQRRRKSAA